jgi:hypothetical protein
VQINDGGVFRNRIYKRTTDKAVLLENAISPASTNGHRIKGGSILSPQGNYLVLNFREYNDGILNSILVYRRTGDYFTQINTSNLSSANDPSSFAFTKDEQHLVIAYSFKSDATQRLKFYKLGRSIESDAIQEMATVSSPPPDGLRGIAFWV